MDETRVSVVHSAHGERGVRNQYTHVDVSVTQPLGPGGMCVARATAYHGWQTGRAVAGWKAEGSTTASALDRLLCGAEQIPGVRASLIGGAVEDAKRSMARQMEAMARASLLRARKCEVLRVEIARDYRVVAVLRVDGDRWVVPVYEIREAATQRDTGDGLVPFYSALLHEVALVGDLCGVSIDD